MRRYKMAMQVTKNLQDLMNLDCVVAVRKCSSETTLHGCIRETVKRWLEYVMCPAEYETHKDDEI